jgi:hypothetical protein
MKTAILLLNFGEPEHATMEEVVPFLERIFNLNVSLEEPAQGGPGALAAACRGAGAGVDRGVRADRRLAAARRRANRVSCWRPS